MPRVNILKILPWLFFFIPLNIYIIGDWLGTGVQWALFRYQQTIFGSSFILHNNDVQYILDSIFTGKTALSVLSWSMGIIFLALMVLVSNNSEEKSRAHHAGVLCVISGSLFLFSDIIQYGISLNGPAGVCIPTGIPLFIIAGWWLWSIDREQDEKTATGIQKIYALFSSIWNSAVNLFEKHPSICIFFFLCCVYNIIYGVNTNGDTIPATYLPLSILQYHNLYFDQFGRMAIHEGSNYAYLLIDNHYYSLFPIVTPILVTPIYAVSVLLFNGLSVPFTALTIILIAKTSAVIITALSGVVLYQVIRELVSQRIAIISTFLYAFATSTWSISSQALWQQGMGELILILMLLCIVRNEKNKSTVNILLLGIFSGLFVFNRPPDALLVIPIVYYIIRFYRNQFRYYALAGILIGLPFLLYNLLIFGTVFGGYSHDFHQYVFNGNFVIHYVGLLVSPNAGLFIFTPFLIFSVFGYFKLKNIHPPPLENTLSIFGPVILLTILAYSFFNGWYSEWCYGPRYLIGILPVLILYCALFFDDLKNHPLNRLQKTGIIGILILLVAVSVIIQFIGVFYYNFLPSKGMDDHRVWDWNDSIIAGSFTAGYGKNITITMYSFPPLAPVLRYRFTGGG